MSAGARRARAAAAASRAATRVRCALDRFAVRSRDAHHRQRGARRALRRRLVRGEARRATAPSSGAASCAAALAPRGATSSAAASGVDPAPRRPRDVGCGARDGERPRAPGAGLARRAERPRLPRRGASSARGSGLDDTPWGPAALEENADAVEHALRTLDTHDTRAARGGLERRRDGGGTGRPVARGRQDGSRRRAARALPAVQGAGAARQRRGDGSATRRGRQGGRRAARRARRATRSRRGGIGPREVESARTRARRRRAPRRARSDPRRRRLRARAPSRGWPLRSRAGREGPARARGSRAARRQATSARYATQACRVTAASAPANATSLRAERPSDRRARPTATSAAEQEQTAGNGLDRAQAHLPRVVERRGVARVQVPRGGPEVVEGRGELARRARDPRARCRRDVAAARPPRSSESFPASSQTVAHSGGTSTGSHEPVRV